MCIGKLKLTVPSVLAISTGNECGDDGSCTACFLRPARRQRVQKCTFISAMYNP